ncbi:MAG: DUF4870 domain-containing protein [Verrucomicrobia bacterium]|nr:DUF4870 domain-containing protein [Verrucomicrobiota bacterium]
MNTPPMNDAEVRRWNMLCHLTALLGLIIPVGGNIVGPLVIWQLKKNEIPSTDLHGKAAVNFQITVSLAMLAMGVITMISFFLCIGWLIAPLFLVIWWGGLILSTIAGIQANDGKDFKYPWSLKIIP